MGLNGRMQAALQGWPELCRPSMEHRPLPTFIAQSLWVVLVSACARAAPATAHAADRSGCHALLGVFACSPVLLGVVCCSLRVSSCHCCYLHFCNALGGPDQCVRGNLGEGHGSNAESRGMLVSSGCFSGSVQCIVQPISASSSARDGNSCCMRPLCCRCPFTMQ